jgi:phasin family protein
MPVNANANSGTQKAADAAHATETAGRAGFDAARDTLQTGVDTAVQSFQRMTDQFSRVMGFTAPNSDELTRRSTESIHAVSQAGTVLAKGVQQISQEWFGLAQERFTHNLEGLNRLARCQSVQDFMAIQSELVRENLESALGMGQRVAELSNKLANEAAGAVQAQTGTRGVQVDRNANRPRQVG